MSRWFKKLSMPEYFRFMSYMFDIDKANQIARRRTPVALSPEQVRQVRFPLVSVNQEHLGQVDLTKPLILATVAYGSGEQGVVMIDGYHRAERAIREHVGMSAIILSFEETLSILTDKTMVNNMQKLNRPKKK